MQKTTRSERALDIAITFIVLPFALLVGLAIAIAVKLDSPGPVFYRCTRVGVGGRRFTMLKFRKMRRCAQGGPLTTSNDDRFTPIGSFLALTKLDELPQLWNVLKGEMRLVGPRPEVEEFVTAYEREYREILTVLPGITGPAAVMFANESALLAQHTDAARFYTDELLPQKIRLDVDYVRHRSLRGDLVLLASTSATPLLRLARRLRQLRRESGGTLYRQVGWGMLGSIMALVFVVTSASPI